MGTTIKYVVRVVSTSSQAGKTEVGTNVVSYLLRMGYDVGVIKHCSHGIDPEVKDTLRYVRSGVRLVVASSKDLLATYESQVVDDLEYILRYVSKPIVIVEGFRDQVVGDSIGVIRSLEDLRELTGYGRKLDAVVSNDEDVLRVASSNGIATFRLGDYSGIARWVEERAFSTVMRYLPGSDCGVCGFSACSSFAKAYLMGLAGACPVMLDVRLVVDDRSIALNPFVKRLISSLVNGLVSTLKDVPPRRRRILIEVSY